MEAAVHAQKSHSVPRLSHRHGSHNKSSFFFRASLPRCAGDESVTLPVEPPEMTSGCSHGDSVSVSDPVRVSQACAGIFKHLDEINLQFLDRTKERAPEVKKKESRKVPVPVATSFGQQTTVAEVDKILGSLTLPSFGSNSIGAVATASSSNSIPTSQLNDRGLNQLADNEHDSEPKEKKQFDATELMSNFDIAPPMVVGLGDDSKPTPSEHNSNNNFSVLLSGTVSQADWVEAHRKKAMPEKQRREPRGQVGPPVVFVEGCAQQPGQCVVWKLKIVWIEACTTTYRRYRHFLALKEDLDKMGLELNVPFPPKIWGQVTTQDMLERKSLLQGWISCAVDAGFRIPSARPYIEAFLHPEHAARLADSLCNIM